MSPRKTRSLLWSMVTVGEGAVGRKHLVVLEREIHLIQGSKSSLTFPLPPHSPLWLLSFPLSGPSLSHPLSFSLSFHAPTLSPLSHHAWATLVFCVYQAHAPSGVGSIYIRGASWSACSVSWDLGHSQQKTLGKSSSSLLAHTTMAVLPVLHRKAGGLCRIGTLSVLSTPVPGILESTLPRTLWTTSPTFAFCFVCFRRGSYRQTMWFHSGMTWLAQHSIARFPSVKKAPDRWAHSHLAASKSELPPALSPAFTARSSSSKWCRHIMQIISL